MSVRKKILILFEGAHIAYSPTIAQLYGELEKDFEVTIFAQNPGDFSKNISLPYRLEVYKYKKGISSYFYRAMFMLKSLVSKEAKQVALISNGNFQDYYFRFFRIKQFVNRKQFDKIICVDVKNLLFVNSILKTRSYFLSLELFSHEKLMPLINTSLIDCVIIQSPMRYEYIFKNKTIRTFYIQNAPVYNAALIKEKRSGLIYSGTAWAPFGFEYCLNYLKEHNNEQLTVLGTLKDKLIEENSAFAELLSTKRLIINPNYISDEEVVPFIADFEIGFCFYNFDFDWINTFNYLSAPSGKIFKYLAAGVPVICNKIPGFDFVDEFECGVRLNNFDPNSIEAAVKKIRSNYTHYINGTTKAAEHFSFNKAVKPFLEFAKADIN